MLGKVIRSVADFYTVDIPEVGAVECKAKGVFRNRDIKPLVGDDVFVEWTDEKKEFGNITEILPRKNRLVRPAVTNVDQAVVLFALSYPKPNFSLLDRFLFVMRMQDVPTVICFNKLDECEKKETEQITRQYINCGSQLIFTSAFTGEGIGEFRRCLWGNTNVFAGPSGVGKSSVLNALFPEAKALVGAVSKKIKRGKNTTRHTELFALGGKTYVVDTPGFTSLELPEVEAERVKDYFPEFFPYEGQCRFLGCLHLSEPDCRVKRAVSDGEIAKKRYEHYTQFCAQIRERKQTDKRRR